MPYPSLLYPEPVPLRQATADPYFHRRHSNTVLSQSLWVSGSWSTEGLFEPSECLWWEWGLILNANSPLLPSCWGFSALGCGVSPQSHSHAVQPPRTGWHTLGHFISVNTFQRIETVQSLFSGPSEINLEIDKNFLSGWKLRNLLSGNKDQLRSQDEN